MQFYYLNRVEILSGFYKGSKGTIVKYHPAEQLLGTKYEEMYEVEINSRGIEVKNLRVPFKLEQLTLDV